MTLRWSLAGLLIIKLNAFAQSYTITTIAGTGISKGDGGQAIDAALSDPADLAADSVGNLYVVDAGNARLRHIAPNGVIQTIAGNGGSSASGVSTVGAGGPAKGIDSNHLITSSVSSYQAQIVKGWNGEGIVMCAPGG